MNLAFLDPLTRNALCEGIEDTLDDGSGNRATALGFNRRGTMLAVGYHDGRVIVWDFVTRQIFKTFVGHVRPITSFSWSLNGRYFSSTSMDYTLKLWDIVSGRNVQTKDFESIVLRADFHPNKKDLLLVSVFMELPRLINTETKEEIILDPKKKKDQNEEIENEPIHVVAQWDFKGKRIYIGNNEGVVTVLDSKTYKRVDSFSITDNSSGRSAIKSFSFSRDSAHFLVNSTDKSIRVYSLLENEAPPCIVRDAVDKLQFKVCHFFGDDFLIGCSGEIAVHKIFIWNKWNGQIHKILEGPKEGILDLTFHPNRTIFATASPAGCVYIWGKLQTENWSAFAPNFTELEENEEYIEREDEFDEIEENQEKKEEEIDYSIMIDIGDDNDDDENFVVSHAPVVDHHYTPKNASTSPLKKKNRGRPPIKKPRLNNEGSTASIQTQTTSEGSSSQMSLETQTS